MLVSTHFMASEFISDYELPQILERAGAGGTIVIPLIVDYCLFAGSGLDEYQSINSPDNPLIAMTVPEQGKTLLKLAQTIKKHLPTARQ